MTSNKLVELSELQYGHWLATATVLPNSQIMIMSDSPKPVNPGPKDWVKVREGQRRGATACCLASVQRWGPACSSQCLPSTAARCAWP